MLLAEPCANTQQQREKWVECLRHFTNAVVYINVTYILSADAGILSESLSLEEFVYKSFRSYLYKLNQLLSIVSFLFSTGLFFFYFFSSVPWIVYWSSIFMPCLVESNDEYSHHNLVPGIRVCGGELILSISVLKHIFDKLLRKYWLLKREEIPKVVWWHQPSLKKVGRMYSMLLILGIDNKDLQVTVRRTMQKIIVMDQTNARFWVMLKDLELTPSHFS